VKVLETAAYCQTCSAGA